MASPGCERVRLVRFTMSSAIHGAQARKSATLRRKFATVYTLAWQGPKDSEIPSQGRKRRSDFAISMRTFDASRRRWCQSSLRNR
jgi:hypothetical protein